MASCNRPYHYITSCNFHNIREAGVWVPMSLNIYDWVTMLPSCKGSHKVHRTKQEEIWNHCKGHINSFKVANNGWFAKGQHVYMTKDMALKPIVVFTLQVILCEEVFGKYYVKSIQVIHLSFLIFIYFSIYLCWMATYRELKWNIPRSSPTYCWHFIYTTTTI